MSDWRNSPLAIAGIVGSTVLSGTLFIMFTYVIPVYQKDDGNKISELTRKLESKELLVNEMTKTNSSAIKDKDSDLQLLNKVKNSEIETLKAERDKANSKVAELEKTLNFIDVSSMYQKGALLPIGFDAIEVGDTKEDLFKYYESPKLIVSDSGNYISVNVSRAGIDHIVYYLDRRNKNTISHIVVFKGPSYSLDEKIREQVENLSFKDLLLNNLGHVVPCKGKYYIWNFPAKKVSVYYEDGDLKGGDYSIHSFKSYPGLFDEECAAQNLKNVQG